MWPEDIRHEVLEIVRRPFCSFGYDRVLLQHMGDIPELRGFCTEVKFDGGATAKYEGCARGCGPLIPPAPVTPEISPPVDPAEPGDPVEPVQQTPQVK